MKKEFCLIEKCFLDKINGCDNSFIPTKKDIRTLFGIGFCEKKVIYYNKINHFTVKRVYIRILSLIVSAIFELCVKGAIIANLNDEMVIKDLLRLIKNSGIGDFIMKNGEYYYFNLDIVKNENSYDIYCNVSGTTKNERFFICWFPIEKSNKINGLKHNAIIIDELPKVKFDYKEMVKLTKQAIKNG